MENITAILKTINDKIATQEDIIEMYRKETAEKDATIRELENKAAELEKALNESETSYAKLNEAYDKQRDDLDDYKAANEALKAEINNISAF